MPSGCAERDATVAALVLTRGALALGAAALLCAARPVLARPPADVAAGLLTAAAVTAVLSWGLAIAAVLTAASVLRVDAGDAGARRAVLLALPGAVLGTVAVVGVAVVLLLLR